MTPEAVIYRYLLVANTEPVDVVELVHLIGTDADLLGHWLNLMHCPASPEALHDALAELDANTLKKLAEAQAWSVLPVIGTARLGLDQWQIMLRAACLGEELGHHTGLTEHDALRWKILLAISGVNLSIDPLVGELIEYRGTHVELLEDASPLLKIFSVVDAVEAMDESQAATLAEKLLGVSESSFTEICESASANFQDLLVRFDILDDGDVDWAERFWTQLQVSMLSGLFSDCRNLESLYAAHKFASRSLFNVVPVLLLLDDEGRTLSSTEGDGVRIQLTSLTSIIARSVRDEDVQTLNHGPQAAVVDRQVLHTLHAAEGLCVPLSSSGQSTGVLVFAVDEDVNNEFAMRTYAQELAKRIVLFRNEMDDDLALLRRYQQREEKRLREIAHEANNPLSIVHNYLHILELRLQHEPSAIEQLNLIGTELKRAGEIIQRIKDTGDVEREDSIAFVEFDVNELIRRIFELHRGYAEDQRVTLHLDLSRGMLPVTSDDQRVNQVLNNLMRNAIEASSEQNVTVSSISGVFREGLEGIELAVRDTGPGLTRSVLEKLAEPKQSSKGGDHAGLGLHIVHRLVSELHGSIDVRTMMGQGTTFTIFLPLDPPI